jgi:hypothetical protein
MKKILMAGAFTLAGLVATGGIAHADYSEAMKDSKYCRNNSYDVLCMGPESLEMRTQMMGMTKEKAMESRTKYCTEDGNSSDPICNKDTMNNTTGY